MKKTRLLSTTTILVIVCVFLLGVTSSFSDLESEQKSNVALLSDDDTGTDTDTGTDSGTEDSGTPPEPGMLFNKAVDVAIECPSQNVTWTKSWTISNSLISTSYSNGKVDKGPAWGETMKYTTSGSLTIPAFTTNWIKCVTKWAWGCDPCPPTDACTIGCG